jgi:hypothetical protein
MGATSAFLLGSFPSTGDKTSEDMLIDARSLENGRIWWRQAAHFSNVELPADALLTEGSYLVVRGFIGVTFARLAFAFGRCFVGFCRYFCRQGSTKTDMMNYHVDLFG